MLTFTEKLTAPAPAQTTLTLPFDARQKSRLRATLDDGREAGLMLTRGTLLRGGDLLRAADGTVVEVRAAPESVSTAFARDAELLTRAAYHLGNRHIAVQIGDTWLRYLHDHVLDHMLEQLGLRVSFEQAPFEPEAGAYDGQGHGAHAHAPMYRAHEHHGHTHD
jgi:urease accessory protein